MPAVRAFLTRSGLLPLAISAALASGSCARVLPVELSPEAEPRWTALVEAHPLPGGYRWVPAGARADGSRRPRRRPGLSVALRGWDDPPPPEGARVVASRALAATVDLLATREEIALRGLRGPAEAATESVVVPLDDVALPRRLVAVDGLYPGEPGYPLREELVLTCSSRDPALETWIEARAAEAARPPRILWIAVAGDTLLDRGVDRLLASGEAGVERVFGDTLPLLRGADLAACNLEGAVTLRARPQAKAYTFRGAPAALAGLASAGFDYVSLTNNHSFDFGAEGFLDTLEALEAAGIATSGAGRDAREALEPRLIDLGESPVRLWSLAAYPVEGSGWDGRAATRAGPTSAGVLWADAETLAAVTSLLDAAPEGAVRSFDVVMVHGGEEWHGEPAASQRRLYRSLASAGAELVVGSHPHLLQGVESLGSSLILYSLGNFLFPGMEAMPGATESVIALVGVHGGRIVALRLVPVVLDGTTVRLARTAAPRLRMLALSRALEPLPPPAPPAPPAR